MTTFTFKIAADIRAYGSVDVEADTFEEAKAKVTASYVAHHFEPHGSGEDDLDHGHPRAIFSEYAVNGDTDEEIQLEWDIPPGEWDKDHTLNDRELATVLAALRFWQREGWADDDIAGDNPLSADEIDELCERLNH